MRQYPLKSDAVEGIRPVVQELLEAKVIVPCEDSPCNTPLFPVKKQAPSQGWRMVQDLQAVNNAVVQRAPCVPDPHTLLNTLKADSQWFSVIDISNAFFSIPVHEDSQYWFAFTFEGKRFTFTRLPQGYCESPTIFSQAMTASVGRFSPPGGSQILLYVDDILIASSDRDTCKTDTIALLNHLAAEGHKASKNKLQFCRQEVKYLGHNLSNGGRTILADRKTTVLHAPKPKTKKQLMSFLGLTNYCRSWIPNYAEIVQPLSDLMYNEAMAMTAQLKWTENAEQAFCDLKQSLVSASALALPNYQKTFIQMVDCKGHFMTSVLTQKHGDKLRPVAYYSTKMDAVTCALPNCVRAVIAASLAVEASAGVVLFHDTVLKVPHAVSALLLQTNMTFLSPARHLSCMAILLSQSHITLERCTTLNPATLIPTEDDGDPHDCQELAETTTKCRKDLKDTPLPTGHVLFVDGSSRKGPDGTTKTGYAVVTQTEVMKAEPLSPSYSAQAAELVALTEACKLMKGEVVTIYTDSQYAFSTVHVFAQYWENRGMITSTGKPVTHKTLLQELLAAVQLPREVAICKCAAHTKGTDKVTKGNAFADEMAKEAAMKTPQKSFDNYNVETTDQILIDMQTSAPKAEKDLWIKKGAKLKNDVYV